MAPHDIQQLIDHWEGSSALKYAFRWLYKDGLETGFYDALLQRAPVVTSALAARGYFEGFQEYADALRIADVEARRKRLEELEKEPGATWKATANQVRPEDLPLLEAWIDRCANFENGGGVGNIL